MKMILEFGTMEAKNAVQSGALLDLLEVMADFEKANEAPSRDFAGAFNKAYPENLVAQPCGAQSVQQPRGVPTPPPQTPVGQPMYPSSLPNTVQQPVPQTGPVQQQMQPQVTIPVSTAPTYSMDQLAVAATQLVDAGQLELLRGILQNFGVTALTELQKDKYGEFATVLRQNGVKI